jgi:cell division initiation protein
MKLTPLDIHHKEFGRKLRGYDEESVDAFLDDVADEFERLFKENIDLSEKLDIANDKVRSYAEIEKTLHNTMLAAQTSAEEIKAKASKEADVLLRDAELKAKELIQTALAEKQKTQSELMRIKAAEDDFRLRFRQMLEDYQRAIHELGVDPQAAALVGIVPEEMAGEAAEEPHFVEDVLEPPSFVTEASAAVEPEPAGPKPIPPFKPDLDAASSPPSESMSEAQSRPQARATRHLDGGTQPLQLEEPPSTGFVQSLTLGEVSGPDLRPDTPTFDEPGEFPVSPRGPVGERDEDVDIEEID